MSERKFKDGDRVIVKVQPEKVMFPVGTIGIVEAISDMYKVYANNDYWYYQDDGLELAEDSDDPGLYWAERRG